MFSKCDGRKNFIAKNMTDIITYVDIRVHYSFYYGSGINHLYRYLGIIGFPANLNYSIQHSHYFGLKTNTGSGSMYPVILALRGRQWILCDCFGHPVHKYEYCIIRGPDLLPPIIL